jgi:hypothetical protein
MTGLAMRAAMVPVTSRVRAYFAPVNRNADSPTIFNPAKYSGFDLDAPPAPWISVGAIANFARSSGTATETLLAGSPPASTFQYRCALSALIEFDFRDWGKLQMALAAGVQHLNVLAAEPSADPQPSGGTPLAPVALLPGSNASEIIFGPGAVDTFAPGDILAIDVDYNQETGFVGTGVSAAFVRDPMDVQRDANYTRRVTFNVARIAQKTTTSVLLSQALIGGPPLAGAGAQKVVAFVDREGGSFFQEWSALFVFEEQAGGRVCFYYPRLSPTTPNKKFESGFPREKTIPIADPIEALTLHAAFTALPFNDRADGEKVLSYRYYFPVASAAVY